MDFISLVGPTAYIAKQLEIWWFWELHDCGKLIRKRHHSMPFLRRNITYTHRSNSRRLNHARNVSEQISTTRRKESNDSMSNKRARMTLASSSSLPTKQSKSINTTFQSYIESPAVRQKIMENIPKEMQHDDVLILERIHRFWLENNDDASSNISEAAELTNISSSSSDLSPTVLDVPSGCTDSNVYKMLSPDAVLPVLHHAKDQMKVNSIMERNPSQLPAFIHYLHMQSNNLPATFVENIDGRICPLCGVDGTSNEGLLDHCGTYHGRLLGPNKIHSLLDAHGLEECVIEGFKGEEGQLHIILRGIPIQTSTVEQYVPKNFVFFQPKRKCGKRQITIPFLQRRHDTVASLDSATRNKRVLALQASDAPASIISAYLPSEKVPIRQYFHSRTNLPMAQDEWMVDSDDEIDETWLHEMSSELLNELEDVTSKEKQFMSLWNRFIKCNHVLADKDIPSKCHEFILIYRNKLRDTDLRLNLLLHLMNLWDSGVISAKRISHCMSIYDATECITGNGAHHVD
jgi:hypothetical protein